MSDLDAPRAAKAGILGAMQVLKILLVFTLGFALIWLVTLSVRVDALYVSVHNAGYRFSKVVPTGDDIGSHRFSNQFVRIEPASYYSLPSKRPAYLDQPVEPAPRIISAKKERLVLPGVLTLMGALSMLTLTLARRGYARTHPDSRQRSLLQASVGVCAGGILLGIGFMLFRVFLTGIDNALIARATQVGSEMQQYYIARQTLSMSWPTLVMLYLGIAMLAYPVMTAIGVRVMGIGEQSLGSTSKRNANDGDVSLTYRIMNGMFASCYVLLMLSFLLSPWTNTILGTILIS